jgi:hypothetical protein
LLHRGLQWDQALFAGSDHWGSVLHSLKQGLLWLSCDWFPFPASFSRTLFLLSWKQAFHHALFFVPALHRLVEYVLRGRERPAGGGQGRSGRVRLRPHLPAATVVRACDVARVGMEGVRMARGRGLYRLHHEGRFATGFQSPFAPVSNDSAGARGGVWVVHAVWEDSPPPASHTHLAARALPPPLPKCGGGGGGEGQEAASGVSHEA